MTDEIKTEILTAWNRYLKDRERRYKRNEGSSIQFEDTARLFKEGVINHKSLSKNEKLEILSHMGSMPA